MRRKRIATGIALAATCIGLAALGPGVFPVDSAENRRSPVAKGLDEVKVGDYTIVGPYTHRNLSVFLIHGKDKIKGKTFLTLQEAMDQKKIVIHETGSVGELIIENPSDVEIYIQSGDIVKGGKQDRVLSFDVIVPSRSGGMRVKSFCVERGRWSQRGGEAAGRFSTSANAVATQDLKLALRKAGSQQAVWANVAKAQEKLAANVGGSVRSSRSESSLQLSLEDSRVKKQANRYIRRLSGIIDGKRDVVGYAFAINGKVNSVDIYACNALFRKLWPKLLEATAIEALAEFDKGKKFEPVALKTIKKCILDAERGRSSQKRVNDRIRLRVREAPGSTFFETQDEERGGEWIHRSYLYH